MRRLPIPILLGAAALAAAAPLSAGPPEAVPPAAGRTCAVTGFAFGGGLEGIPVWSGPSERSEPVGVLPPPDPDDEMGGRMDAEFEIVEARGGWFRIENGGPWLADHSNPPPGLSGWVSGRHVTFSLQTEMGFAEPDPASAARYRSRDRIEPHILAALDCRGGWVKLLFSEDGEVREGWFRGVCANQETSCDMPPGDAYRD